MHVLPKSSANHLSSTNPDHLVATTVPLEKDGIEKKGRSNNQTLLGHGRTLGKIHLKGICLGKDLSQGRLWLLENLPNERSIASGVCLRRWEDTKGHLATALAATGVAFGEAIDTASTTARGLVNLVHGIAIGIRGSKGGDAVPAVLLEGTEELPTRIDVDFLVAAALAASCSAAKRTIDGEHFSLRVELLHLHGEWMIGGATQAATTVRVFDGVGNLSLADKVLELGTSFASHDFLAEAAAGLGTQEQEMHGE